MPGPFARLTELVVEEAQLSTGTASHSAASARRAEPEVKASAILPVAWRCYLYGGDCFSFGQMFSELYGYCPPALGGAAPLRSCRPRLRPVSAAPPRGVLIC